MEIIQTCKGGGKTTKLIEEAKKLKGYNLVICKDLKRVSELWREIILKKYDLPQPITFDEFIRGAYCGHNINAFLIDDADMLIQYMAKGVKIHAITITNENMKPDNECDNDD